MADLLITNEGPLLVLDGLFEDLTSGYLPYWTGSALANSPVWTDGTALTIDTLGALSLYSPTGTTIGSDATTPIVTFEQDMFLGRKMRLGEEDVANGLLEIYANASSPAAWGGMIRLHTAGDSDDTIFWYNQYTSEDDFIIASSGDEVTLTLTPEGTLSVNTYILGAQVAVGGYYFNSGGDPATELGYGTWTQVAQGQFLVGAV